MHGVAELQLAQSSIANGFYVSLRCQQTNRLFPERLTWSIGLSIVSANVVATGARFNSSCSLKLMTSQKWILISLSESGAFLEILVRMAKGDWDGKSQLEI